MLFSSFAFIIFFPIICIGYYLIPWHHIRNLFLLVASYIFYMFWNVKYSFLLMGITLFCYVWAIFLTKFDLCKNSKKKTKKLFLGIGVFIPIFVLFLFKYFNFVLASVNGLLSSFGAATFDFASDLLLPVGISFYIFQNVSYLVDVYTGDVDTEYQLLDYALYISFFPQLVAGPIELSKNFLVQFKEKHLFDYERVKRGLMLMLWGYFLKIVLADRIGIYVDAVYADLSTYTGVYTLLAALLFPIQIYTDFYGYSAIALGAGEVMGFSMTDNFNAPFFADSFVDLWRRWHISLYNWFLNYVYFPLGGSRRGVWRKYYNLFVVCILSGLWHGANWTYVFWGILVAIFQIINSLTIKRRKSHNKYLRIFRIGFTYFLFAFSVVFFRATSMEHAFGILRAMLVPADMSLLQTIFDTLISLKALIVLIVSLGILSFADWCKYHKISLRDELLQKKLLFQWCIFYLGLLFIIVFGVYGDMNNSFIYFVF